MTVLSLSWQMLVFNNSYHRYMKQENGVRTRGSKVRGEPLNTHLEACRNVVFLNFPYVCPEPVWANVQTFWSKMARNRRFRTTIARRDVTGAAEVSVFI